MAGTNIELQNPNYSENFQASRQQQLLCDSPQRQPIYEILQVSYEKPAVSSLVPELVPKEVVSSNIQHVTNSVGNYSIQKERVKWSILLILLIALSVLNVIILITIFTTQVTCPQVGNTTEMVQSIVQEVLSLRSQEIQERPSNTSEETLLQLINMSYDNIDLIKTHIESSQQQLVHNITALLVNISNNNIQLLTTHIESSKALQQQQLTMIDNNTQMQTMNAQASQLQFSQNITALLGMVDGNSQLVKDHINSTQSSQQLLVHNITALLVNISNNNIQLLTTHIKSSKALQQQQLTMIDNNTQLLEMQTMYAQASQLQLSQNITALLDMANDNGLLLDATNKNVISSLQKFDNIMNTQSIIEDISVENKGTINNILVKVDDVLETLNLSLVSSCQDIKSNQPNCPSGYYHIKSELVYCEMGELCNSTEGGWTRLAYLDMNDSTVDCPSGFQLYENGSVRACGRSSDNAPGCQSIKFPSNGINYSEVCGRVVGYQYGSPDALNTKTNNIDSYYVDGVSITQGNPRKHVWTLINGVYESNDVIDNCPCNTPPGGVQPPSFVGNDYFCESGNPNSYWSHVLYSNDPLWDGEGCGAQEGNCCAAAGLPWFHKTSFCSTTEYLELRVCGNEPITNEDTPISFYELYVK